MRFSGDSDDDDDDDDWDPKKPNDIKWKITPQRRRGCYKAPTSKVFLKRNARRRRRITNRNVISYALDMDTWCTEVVFVSSPQSHKDVNDDTERTEPQDDSFVSPPDNDDDDDVPPPSPLLPLLLPPPPSPPPPNDLPVFLSST